MIQRQPDGTFLDIRARVAVALPSKPKDRPMRIKPTDTVKRVGKKLERHLGRDPAAREGLEYFSISCHPEYDIVAPDDPWEATRSFFRWVAVFAVTGGNEGHYVHVELVGAREPWRGNPKADEASRERVLIFLGKTFGGMRAACAMAARLTILLDA